MTKIYLTICSIVISSISFGMVNVKDYGAVGDGITDDTQAFCTAVNADSRVYVPTGTYLISRFNINSGQYLEGDGISTKLIHKSGTNGYLIHGQDVTDVVIKDMRICGNSAGNPNSGTGIRIAGNSTRVLIENVLAEDFRYDGISFINSFSYCTVKNCHANGNLRDGISFYLGNSSQIIDCMASSNGRFGIIAHTTAGCRVQNCTAYSNFDVNIISVSSNDIIFSGNSTYGSTTKYGLQFNTVTRGVMSNNSAFSNFGVGIDCWNSQNCVLNSNIVYNNTLQGIAIDTYSYYTICSNNQVYSNGGCGISCFKSGSVLISYNQVVNNNQGNHTWNPTLPLAINNPYGVSGIWVHDEAGGESSNVKITGNNCSDDQPVPTQLYGIQIGSSPSGCSVIYNKVTGNKIAPMWLLADVQVVE